MQTQCNADRIGFNHHGRREVTGAFDGGRMSSDGGAPLPREADLLTGLAPDCFTDHRDQNRTGRGLRCPVARGVMGIAPGYGGINGHDILRGDSALAVGRCGVTGDGGRATGAPRWPVPARPAAWSRASRTGSRMTGTGAPPPTRRRPTG